MAVDGAPAPTPRQAALAGARAIGALTFGVIPFGIAYGVVVSQTDIAGWLGIAASLIIIAGAAQLSLVNLVNDGAPWVVAVGTALVINARFFLYSAALAPAFRRFPAAWRFSIPHLMTDQAATLSLLYFQQVRNPVAQRWFYTGAGATIATGWVLATVVGVLGGARIPGRLELEFAIPLVFISLLVPALSSRPAIVAAAAAAVTALAFAGLPNGTNILCGAAAGIFAGSMVRR